MPEIKTYGTEGTLTHQEADEVWAEPMHAAITADASLTSVDNREHCVIISGTNIEITLDTASVLDTALDTTDTGGESVGWWVKLTNNSGSQALILLESAADHFNGTVDAGYATAATCPYRLEDNESIIIQFDNKSATKGYNIVGGFNKARSVFVDGGGSYHSTTSFDIYSNVTEDSFETIGPTGAGATNTWTALDSVPIWADWIEVKLFLRIAATAAGTAQGVVYGIANGETETTSGTRIGVFQVKAVAADDTSMTDTWVKIPVDATNIMKVRWDGTNADGTGTDISMVVAGYGQNSY